MNVAYLVFAYKNPQIIYSLVEFLSNDNCSFFIHIDKKSDIGRFSLPSNTNAYFSDERIPVYWAEFSGVQAILLLIRQAFRSSNNFDYFVLLSGSDYPLRSSRYINAFFKENCGTEFINIVQMPNQKAGKPISRITTLRLRSSMPVRRFIVRILGRYGLVQRNYKKYLGNLEPYSGNTWWALTRDACQYILEFIKCNHDFIKFFENTFAPEETFFHTILGNSAFKNRIRRNLMYEDWSSREAHPATLNRDHLAYFESNDTVWLTDVYGSGEVLFARKYSDDTFELIQKVKSIIAKKESL